MGYVIYHKVFSLFPRLVTWGFVLNKSFLTHILYISRIVSTTFLGGKSTNDTGLDEEMHYTCDPFIEQCADQDSDGINQNC